MAGIANHFGTDEAKELGTHFGGTV
ncbi:protein of unknown function (plasmid) [Caballeronia sp. S22]